MFQSVCQSLPSAGSPQILLAAPNLWSTMALVQGWHRQRKQTHGILPAGSGTSIYSRAKCGELEMPGEEGQEQRGGDNSRLLLQLHQLQRTPAEALPFPGAVPPGVANPALCCRGTSPWGQSSFYLTHYCTSVLSQCLAHSRNARSICWLNEYTSFSFLPTLQGYRWRRGSRWKGDEWGTPKKRCF